MPSKSKKEKLGSLPHTVKWTCTLQTESPWNGTVTPEVKFLLSVTCSPAFSAKGFCTKEINVEPTPPLSQVNALIPLINGFYFFIFSVTVILFAPILSFLLQEWERPSLIPLDVIVGGNVQDASCVFCVLFRKQKESLAPALQHWNLKKNQSGSLNCCKLCRYLTWAH